MGLVGAVMAGADTTYWVAGVKAEIDELDASGYYDVIGLAGALYGLAIAGVGYDPTTGAHQDASNLRELADILTSYQIGGGGFAWNSEYVILDDGNETIQETAYAMLALNSVDRATFGSQINGAADYLLSVQLGTGGWENFAGDGENNEITGEALWALAVAYPQDWVATTGSDTNDGSKANPFATIGKGVNAIESRGTVNVAAGPYAGAVNVNKPLTLNGAQADVAVSGRTASAPVESTISGLLAVNASTVAINGFTLTNPGQTYAVSITPASSGVAITYNLVDSVGAVGLSSNVHAIVMQNGADSVTIAHNRFSNIKANAKSANAIGVLDTTSTNSTTGLVIQGNTFTDIASVTKGAYGIILNNHAGTPSAQITNNTFSALSGGWTHAIGLEGPTPNALVTGNTFSGLTAGGADKSAIFFEDNPDGGSVSIAFNKFNGSDFFGVAIHPKHLDPTWPNNAGTPGAGYVPIDYVASAMNNWWGHASGPNGAPGTTDPRTGFVAAGSGAIVGPSVRFDPWLGAETSAVSSGTPTTGNPISLSGGEVTVAKAVGATGSPTVVVAKYTSNPSSVGTFVGSGSFYDINVTGTADNDGAILEITMPGTGSLNYFDGTTWHAVVGMVGGVLGPVTDSGGVFTFILNNTSTTPRLYQLTGTPFAASSEQIRITPSRTVIAAGETFQVVVDATSVKLFGVDVSMAFDKDELQVTNIVLGKGSAPAGLTAGTIAKNEYNNVTGTLRFAYSQLGTGAVNASGPDLVLATITFLAGPAGATNVTLGSALFTDNDGNPKNPDFLDSPINLTIDPSPTVYVDVALQGRGDYAGLQLEVKPVSTGNTLYDAGAAAHLSIINVPAGSYTARVSAPKYLAAVQDFTLGATVVSYDLNDLAGAANTLVLTLRGGDINGDDQVNIQDLVMIGVRFGKVSTDGDWAAVGDLANINGDLTVNIQDLAIAAGNFGLETEPGTGNTYTTPWQ